MPKKKSAPKMKSAPIKAPAGNIKGIGKLGLFTGGEVPTVIAPIAGLTGAQVVAAFSSRKK